MIRATVSRNRHWTDIVQPYGVDLPDKLVAFFPIVLFFGQKREGRAAQVPVTLHNRNVFADLGLAFLDLLPKPLGSLLHLQRSVVTTPEEVVEVVVEKRNDIV